MGVVLSTELVVWTAVGGKGVWIGPVVGAVLMGWLTAALRDDFAYWEIVEALVFIAVVLRFPAGIAGATLGRIASARPRIAASAAPGLPHSAGADLVFEAVRVRVNGLRILDGLDLQLDRPGLHCMIGPNGAGKTSAFNVLTGRLPLTSGALRWRGVALKGKRPYQIAALGIARKFQIPSVFPNLTVGENLVIAIWANRLRASRLFSLAPYGWKTPRLARLVEMFPFLAETDVRAGALSLGHRQMLEFAMANLMEPGLLLLDEPCAGLSSSETTEMIEAIRVLNAEYGGATLIIEHDMRVVQTLANHVYVLHLGAKLAEGTMAEIKANEAVRAVYAGSEK
jgi:branched-chain amino acid transport system permease protein